MLRRFIGLAGVRRELKQNVTKIDYIKVLDKTYKRTGSDSMKYLLNWKYWILFILISITLKLGLKQFKDGHESAMLMLECMALLCFFAVIHIAYYEGRSSKDKEER
jgi:hypothetical protein